MGIFVLDKKSRPLMPCSEKRARKLLDCRRARVHLLFPFSIGLVDRLLEDGVLQPLRLSDDPGSVTSGLAVCRIEEGDVNDMSDAAGINAPVMHILCLMELVHRGPAIKKSLHARSSMRRRRRGNLRYRAPRFNNRTRRKVWLAPSLQRRIDTTMSWAARRRRLAPITHLAQERVHFDMRKMENPEICGVRYQQGTLLGYEMREYLLDKFNRSCADCDATGVPLQMAHIDAEADGGSNRVSDLTLACDPCNKNARDIREFQKKDPVRLAKILAKAKAPLRDAAAVNATRWTRFEALKKTGLPAETGGGHTNWSRSRLGLPKTRAHNAACVGIVGGIGGTRAPTLRVKCTGCGSRCKTRLNQYGFRRADLPSGKGIHKGRVALRMTGNFNIQTGIAHALTVRGFSQKHCSVIQRADGYGYVWQKAIQLSNLRAPSASRSAPALPAVNAGVSRSNI